MTTVRLQNQTQIDTTEIQYLWFMVIVAGDGTVIRVVNDLKDWVGPREPGEATYPTYTAFPFAVQLMADDGEKVSAVKIQTVNVSRDFVRIVRGQVKAPQVKLYLSLSDAPRSPEKIVDFLTLSGVEYDAATMTFTLAASNIWGRKTCAATFNAHEFKAIHYGVG